VRVDVGVGLDAQAWGDEPLLREAVEFEPLGVAVDHVRVIAGRGHVGEDQYHGLAPGGNRLSPGPWPRRTSIRDQRRS